MSTDPTCSECGNPVKLEEIDGDMVVSVHPNPDDPDQDCPGSKLYPDGI